jgi:hypothetical protein
LSTIYGTVTAKDGREVAVDASQLSDRVALIVGNDNVRALRFGKDDVQKLIGLLEVAYSHCWYDE